MSLFRESWPTLVVGLVLGLVFPWVWALLKSPPSNMNETPVGNAV